MRTFEITADGIGFAGIDLEQMGLGTVVAHSNVSAADNPDGTAAVFHLCLFPAELVRGCGVQREPQIGNIGFKIAVLQGVVDLIDRLCFGC